MDFCSYIYCRARMAEDAGTCAICGYPREKTLLRDPVFLSSVQVPELPQGIVDMHQILPSLEGVLDMQLTMMERYGIAKALIQSAPAEARSLWGNEKLIVLAAEHGDRFWISQFIDPRQHQAIPALEGLARVGAKVVKLLPPAGWQGDDPAFDEFWARMEELNLVAMIHTGFFTARHKTEEKAAGVFMNSRYANPVFFDRTARKFPDLQIILCHAGGAMWFEESAQMITQHDNVWGDISGFGHFALRRLLQLGVTIDWSKLFWGNDSPPYAYPFNLRLTLDSLRRAGADSMTEGLLYDNARQFAQQFLD